MKCLFPFANNIFPEFSHKNLKKTTSKKRKKDIQVFGINSRIIFLTSILSQAIKLMQWNIIIDYQSPLKNLVIPVLDILAETRNLLHTFCISEYLKVWIF